jgi:Flp pilus assembly protein TadG
MTGMTVIDRIKRLRNDCRGVAASEFALILPVLILLLFGTAEIGNALVLDKKVTSAAQTAADLVAQQKSVSSADLANIFTAMDAILSPYGASAANYTIASVVADEDGVVSIDWQEHRGTSVDVEEFDLPEGLLSEDDSVIIALISYTYTPLFADLITGSFTISDTAYLRPRTTTNVDYSS